MLMGYWLDDLYSVRKCLGKSKQLFFCIYDIGWDFSEKDMNENYVQIGYEKGVPMGSDSMQLLKVQKHRISFFQP